MKLLVYLVAAVCLVAFTSQAQVLFSENFNAQTPDATVSGFGTVSPSTATATLGSIVTNVAGNNAMRMYDTDPSNATRVDQDFTPTAGIHFSMSFTRNANIPITTTTQALYLSFGTNGFSQTSQANRTFDVRLYNDGTYRFDRGFQNSSGIVTATGNTASSVYFDSGSLTISAHTLDVYAYSAAPLGATLAYTGPDSVARVLDPNSFAVYIDGALVIPSSSGLTANGNYGYYGSAWYGIDLGRFTLLTSASSNVGMDFLIDDIQLSVIPEPSTFVLLGAGGLLLMGLMRRTRRSR